MKNKTIITCIIPLLGDLDRFNQLESGIIVTWIESCDHVVFVRKWKSLTSDIIVGKTLLRKLQYRRQTTKKKPISYFYIHDNVTEITGNQSLKFGHEVKADDNSSKPVSWLISQFKSVEFAFKKYSDTDIFILTTSVEDIVKYFYMNVYGNSDDNELQKLQSVLRTNNSFDEQALFMLDECLVLGRKAVSKLISRTNLNHCTFKNQRLFNEWAERCIQN